MTYYYFMIYCLHLKADISDTFKIFAISLVNHQNQDQATGEIM